ncbi:MAG: FHA domain-containing protein [Paenibacillus macerans]|uniref:FHA domain protein n=1 Tax=Paenibacillus macerans TaxID=44252 RepID=A0A090ZH10_PAEMA|nr:FHA domain-containing protein [Paenibacillus macerans]KFN10579.1 FHA domain protein [Paenibacillus macerans]MBS5909179.1 FHA domain-containing protein [Paenibacillus macerans]MCY7556853.1 FHA domain-containing protein [Paenibacillus macerans]MDU7472689.1 FHA domain-containing protein [Paenibacillus macerans]MEC0139058.1 FHA domain-containing protein [Paenibacillus macerans]
MSLTRCMNGHMFSSRKHGNTCPYCNTTVEQPARAPKSAQSPAAAADMDEKTMPYLGETTGIQPVTGWLVCVEGPQMGQDYRIMAEKNFIGRAEEMHIRIIGDNAVSRRNHAVIVYDPKKRNFYLLPGDASGLAYHNNEAVYSPVELNAYDLIQLGRSKFVFVPLCGPHFEWDNG